MKDFSQQLVNDDYDDRLDYYRMKSRTLKRLLVTAVIMVIVFVAANLAVLAYAYGALPSPPAYQWPNGN